MSISIQKIVIHCSATGNGKYIPHAAETLDGWHNQRGFKRNEANRLKFNPQLGHIGYHFIINTDGTLETGRAVGEMGAHVKGHNRNSIGICLIGGVGVGKEKDHARFTLAQWQALTSLVAHLKEQFPNAKIYGHRDLSPDLNGDGTITPNEWIKTCPNFAVQDWLKNREKVQQAHLYQGE